jgi:membrane associated rhomboid family serine protease
MELTITLIIIGLTCLVSIPAFNNDKLKDDLLFWPYYIKKKNQYYRFLTAGFLHADATHLLFNMISLYSFGNAIEVFIYKQYFGQNTAVLYVVLYLTAIIIACIPDFFKHQDNYEYRALGASGAVSAIIFAAITIEPSQKLYLFFALPIPGYIFGLAFLALSAYLAKRGGGNIGHNAHFWGAVYGVVFTYIAGKAFANVDFFKSFVEKVF